MEKRKDAFRGCLIGGAVGDALGYTVEFLSEYTINKRYGENGITEYDLVNGVAQISDDTQMTLFTANGLLLGETMKRVGKEGDYCDYIALCYKDWFYTQNKRFPLPLEETSSWLVNLGELFSLRAPGNTCLSALTDFCQGKRGSVLSPINNSKGCGGVMRVAPIGIYFGKEKAIEEVDLLAAEASAITHGHELGYIPSSGLAHILYRIVNDGYPLLKAVEEMIEEMPRLFPYADYVDDFVSLMKKAVELSQSNLSDIDAIHLLGEGWVAEETLAIAIFCALRYSKDFEKAVVASVNHNGDSDSTGAVTGNILGAYLGLSKIPEKYLENLELKEVILTLADDLFDGYREDKDWKKKYIDKTFRP